MLRNMKAHLQEGICKVKKLRYMVLWLVNVEMWAR